MNFNEASSLAKWFGCTTADIQKMVEKNDWCMWRRLEEKVMEDEELGKNYMRQLCFGQLEIYEDEFHLLTLSMKFNLRTRCLALLSALDTLMSTTEERLAIEAIWAKCPICARPLRARDQDTNICPSGHIIRKHIFSLPRKS